MSFGQIEKGTCSNCGRENVYIVRKRDHLCEYCVNLSKQSKSLKPSGGLNSFSKKGSRHNEMKMKTYREIDSSREQICSGCGRSDVPLSHSHLIPESFNKSLGSNSMNIVYHCVSMGLRKGCHEKWESHNLTQMAELLDFEENLEKVRILDENYYNRLTAGYEKGKEN